MRMYDIIMKKRNKQQLNKKEIDYFIENFTKGIIPDYQASALLMAIYFNGMNKREIVDLTSAMINSGDRLDLCKINGIKVDKHSTGGVGDKISLIVLPLVAAANIPVAKMSGRGLGHTGGTIDKLESIQGFNTTLDTDSFINNVNKYKLALVSQTVNLVPADKKIYSLRDVTATVDSMPLIASSIMSKKIASGADAIVLDVKVGAGAFMKSVKEAKELATIMVDIGKALNKKTIAIITDMNEPLGYEIGNANEVKEAIEVLKGKEIFDLKEIALTIGAYMTVLGEAYNDFNTAYKELNNIITTGKGIKKFKEFIKLQGGSDEIIEDYNKFPKAKYNIEIKALKSGYISSINSEEIGKAAMILGAGRKSKNDIIDFAAGITLIKKTGSRINENDIIAILHTNLDEVSEAIDICQNSFSISSIKPDKIKYIHEVIQ